MDTFIEYFYWILLLDTFIGYFYSGKMNLGALDATQHQSVAQEYGVQGYPTIKYFAPGSSGNIRAYIPITQPSSTLHPVAQVILEQVYRVQEYSTIVVMLLEELFLLSRQTEQNDSCFQMKKSMAMYDS